MIIHRLKVSGFQIIRGPLALEFPEEGRIGILGQNESGKTTLLEAIEYALYGLKRGRAAEESRENTITWGKEAAKLEIEFTSGQERFLLRRTFDIRGGHKARLVPLSHGKEESLNAVTSLTEIESKIEQITGMDRDSFTKLVYVKQKDLDALKELAKSRREQLVNKVMGIEIFDDSMTRAKSDLSDEKSRMETMRVELESVRRNAETYEEKLTQRKTLQAETVDLKDRLQEIEGQLKRAEALLEAYDWIYRYTSAKGLSASLNEQRSHIQQDSDQLESLKKMTDTYREVLSKYEPEAARLETLRAGFLTIQNQFQEYQSRLDSLNARQNQAIARIGLTSEECELLKQNLPAKKQRHVALFASALVLSVAAAAASLVLRMPIIGLIAPLFGALAAKFYLSYRKIDNILSSGAEIQVLKNQIEEAVNRLQQMEAEVNSLRTETGFNNIQDLDRALSNLGSEIKLLTGQESIQAVQALLQTALRDAERLEESDPRARMIELEDRLSETSKQLEVLERRKPASAQQVQYDADLHTDARNTVERLRHEHTQLDRDLQQKVGTTKTIEADLHRLATDFNRLPALEAEYGALEDRLRVLETVVRELAETSRDLRSRVIPHASFIVNQILPTLTDGRYSQFEITEDLKFKVYSAEAGGFKERELFSGGTQDQFLIALRLAFTQSILDSRVMADRYSLLMDECISSSDEQRKQGIFEVLELMKKTFTQIFIIAHEDISNFVDHSIVLARDTDGYTEIRSRSW